VKRERGRVLRVSASGWRASLALVALVLFGSCALPRLLARPLSSSEAVRLVRDRESRRVRDTWLPRIQAAGRDSLALLGATLAGALEEVDRTEYTDLRIRRSWVGPPFARRWAFAIRVQEAGAPGPIIYRISRGFASDAPDWYWIVPLF
jgi:hypothetical protein